MALDFKTLAGTYLDEIDQYGSTYIQKKVRACLDENAVKLLEVVEEKVEELHGQVVSLQTAQTEHTNLLTTQSALQHAHTTLQMEHTTLQTTHVALQNAYTELQARFAALESAHAQACNEMNLTLQAWNQKKLELEQQVQTLQNQNKQLGEDVNTYVNHIDSIRGWQRG